MTEPTAGAIVLYRQGVCQLLEGRPVNDIERLRQLEDQLADLKARMPAHTVRPTMIMEMEELEDEIESLRAKVRQEGTGDAQGAA